MVLTSAATVPAQVLPEGTRIRASIPTLSPGHLYGRVLVLSTDSLSLRDVYGKVPEGTYFARNISVSRHAVPTLEYLHSKDRSTGAFYGGLIGLIPAVIAYYDAKSKDYYEYSTLHMLVVGVISVPTFAVVGSFFGPERWERVLPWP